jgi:hypothetical protein
LLLRPLPLILLSSMSHRHKRVMQQQNLRKLWRSLPRRQSLFLALGVYRKLLTPVLPLRPISLQAPPMTCVNILLYLLQLLRVDAHILFSGQSLMKRFVDLGNECVEYLKVAKASEGKSHSFYFYTSLSLHAYLCFLDWLFLSSLF